MTTPPTGAVLVLPGMALNATLFPSFGLPVLEPDFNRSAPGEGPGMTPYLDALDRLVDDPAWTRAWPRVVVGHSFGGMLALAWLLHHALNEPAKVDGLVLVGTTAGPMFDAVRLRLATFGRREWRMSVYPLLRFWRRPTVTRGVKRLLSRGTLRTERVDFRRLTVRGDIAVGIAGWRNTDWTARLAYRRAMEGFDLRNRLGELRVPTVVLHGARDRYFPAAAARTLAEGLRAELRVVPRAGHVLPLTHGDEVVAAVRAVLSVAQGSPAPLASRS